MTTEAVEDVLKQYGVRGMHWGVRKESSSGSGPATATQKKPGGSLRTSGGRGQPASSDALRAATAHRTAVKSGTHALSDNELQSLVKRMNLEQQYSNLTAQKSSRTSKWAVVKTGHAFVKNLLAIGKTANEVHTFVKSPVGEKLKEKLKH